MGPRSSRLQAPPTQAAPPPRELRPTPEQQARLQDNCGPGGMPTFDGSWDFGPLELVVREGYALGYSNREKVPLWVCEHLTSQELSGEVRRDKNPFAVDPELRGPQATLADYHRSGFDRGHMAPAGNQTDDPRLKEQTFFLSNMAPQVHALNDGPWSFLEERARSWSKESGGAWVLTGPLFYDPAEEDASTADGQVEVRRIGPGGVAVPTHFYKVVLRRGPGERTEALAFVMANEVPGDDASEGEQDEPSATSRHGKRGTRKEGKRSRRERRPDPDLRASLRSIDWIEARTGLDLFPSLPRAEQEALESARPSALW